MCAHDFAINSTQSTCSCIWDKPRQLFRDLMFSDLHFPQPLILFPSRVPQPTCFWQLWNLNLNSFPPHCHLQYFTFLHFLQPLNLSLSQVPQTTCLRNLNLNSSPPHCHLRYAVSVVVTGQAPINNATIHWPRKTEEVSQGQGPFRSQSIIFIKCIM